MRLKDVIRQGKFCGLESVGECLLNWELHCMQMYPYNALEYECNELAKDIKAYEAGELKIDMDEIDRLVEQDKKEYEEYLNNHPPEVLADTDFELDAMFEVLK